MRTIQARIHEDALKRVAQFFNATFPETLAEVLQNARRSGAKSVDIELGHDGSVLITDDGEGIADPGALLSFGESQWDKTTQEGEGAAGMGVYSLARWRPTIQSRTRGSENGWAVSLDESHFSGNEPAGVVPDADAPSPHGTRVRMRVPARPASNQRQEHKWEETLQIHAEAGDGLEAWKSVYTPAIANAARYYPLPVRLDGEPVEQFDYLEKCCHIREWKGLAIGIRKKGHRLAADSGQINFHGKTIEKTLLPFERTRDGRTWEVQIDVRQASGLELTLPARNSLVEGEFTDRTRHEAQRTIFLAMAAAKTPVDVDWATRTKAAAMGIDLPIPPAVLAPWEPERADNDYSPRSRPSKTCGDQTLVIGNNGGAAKQQTLWRAVAGTPLEERLMGADPGLAGYAWYDELPRVRGVRLEGTAKGTTFVRDDYEDPAPAPEEAPERMEMVLEVTSPNGDSEIRTPVNMAFWESEESVSWPPDVPVVITKGSTVTAPEIADFLQHAYFSPSDDCESDSYDTQLQRFEEDALAEGHRLISNPADALASVVERMAERTIAYEVGAGQSVTLTVARDAKGKLQIGVEAR